MPAIEPDQEFETLVAFKKALQVWAIEARFQPKILDSDSKRVRVGCRSGPDCQFRIRCNFNDKDGKAKVTTLEGDHSTHIQDDPNQAVRIHRPEASKMKFLVHAVPGLMEVTSETSTKDIIDAVTRAYGSQIMLRQAQKVKAYLLRKNKHNKCRLCGQEGHNKRNCPQRQSQQRAGSGPSSETMDATMQSDADGEGVSNSNSEEEAPRTQEQHCRICHQSGHNRRLCPQKDAQQQVIQAPPPAPPVPRPVPGPVPSSNKRSRVRPAQRPMLGPVPDISHHDLAGHDEQGQRAVSMAEDAHYTYTAQPDMSDNNLFQSPGVAVLPPASSSRAAPIVHTNVFAAQEAARLMQEAARLTQEAARLNHQAANLMASVLG